MTVRTLVLDIGTSSIRTSVVRGDGQIERELVNPMLPDSPASGLVEFDAARMASTALAMANEVLTDTQVDGVGITNQRSSTVLWDRKTGEPVGRGLGWQDLRTIGECFMAREHGLRLAPNQAATKAQWLWDQVDKNRDRDLVVGTVDSWIAWVISNGSAHITDSTNAGVTGLCNFGPQGLGFFEWDAAALAAMNIPERAMARIVSSAGEAGRALALAGQPPIVALIGDQQASLAGQSCVETGQAKITFGTGGMLNLNLGDGGTRVGERYTHGSFPIAAWRIDDTTTWGLEAIMLGAGTNIEWLRDDMGLIDSAADSDQVAAQCDHTDGVVYVPALVGIGTPHWDHGARSALFGITRGTTRSHIVRAVLEGVAQRGTDLVEAAEADSGIAIDTLRIDGGMSDNTTFVQALANASQRPIEVSRVREATTLGAGLLAALALGEYKSMADIAGAWAPRTRIEPGEALDREKWNAAVERSRKWIPELSAIDF